MPTNQMNPAGLLLDSKTVFLYRMDSGVATSDGEPDATGLYPLTAVGSVPSVQGQRNRARQFFNNGGPPNNNLVTKTSDVDANVAKLITLFQSEFTLDLVLSLAGFSATEDLITLRPGVSSSDNTLFELYVQASQLHVAWRHHVAVQEVHDGPSVATSMLTGAQPFLLSIRKRRNIAGNYFIEWYINGVYVSSSSPTPNCAPRLGDPQQLYFGSAYFGSASTLWIDECRLSSIVRTDAEMLDSWNRMFNSAPLSATAPASYSHIANRTMWMSLIRPIRDADMDQGRLVLQRFLARQEYNADQSATRIRSLNNTEKFSKIADGQVKYLKDHVGFTKELSKITSNLSTATLRKLGAGAIAFWKRRGTPQSLTDLLRLLTTRSAVLRDWFYYRTILGEGSLADEQLGLDYYINGGGASTQDEFFSNLRVMDPGIPNSGHALDANTHALWRLDETLATANAIDATGRYPLVPATGNTPLAPGLIGGPTIGSRIVSTATLQTAFSGSVTDGLVQPILQSGNWTWEGWCWIDPAVTGVNFPWNNFNGTLAAFTGGGVGPVFIVGFGAGGTMRYYNGADNRAGTWTGLAKAEWHHIAFRSTALNATQATVDVFINGVLVGTMTPLTIPTTMPSPPSWVLGGEGGTFDTFVGRMDDVRFSKVSRTNAEILADAQAGKTFSDTTVSQLILDIANLCRPISERQEIVLLDFLDTFDDGGRSRWNNITPGTGGAATVDAVTKNMILTPGCEEEAKITIVGPDMLNKCLIGHKFKLGNVANTHSVKFNLAPDGSHYRLDVTKNQMVLNRVSSAAVVTPIARSPSSNSLLWSEQLQRFPWTTNGASVTPDAIAGPDGLVTADKIIDTAVNAEHYIEQYLNGTFGGTLPPDGTLGAGSAFAKAAERSWLFLAFVLKDNATVSGTWFNLSTGAIGSTFGGFSSAIYPMANGWYRCQTWGSIGAGSVVPRLRLKVTTADAQATYLGDGVSGLYAVGAQMQLQPSVGVYLPTTDSVISQTPFLLAANVEYGLRIQAIKNASNVISIKVFLDGSLMIDFRDNAAPSISGAHRILNPGSSPGNNIVDNVELSRIPARSAIVAPSGYTYSPNFLTG